VGLAPSRLGRLPAAHAGQQSAVLDDGHTTGGGARAEEGAMGFGRFVTLVVVLAATVWFASAL
jgi:hypothetical protein